MNSFILIAGFALALIALVDAIWTVLWLDGASGPVTSRLTSAAWKGFLSVIGRRHNRLLSLAGPTLQVIVVLVWMALLWAGWLIAFSAETESLADSNTPGVAGITGRMWFVAYTMFTVGNGEFYPNGGFWQIVSSFTAGSGLFLITLAITFLVSVASANARKRAFATGINSLGMCPEELVQTAWDGQQFTYIDQQLASFASQLNQLTEQHRAYPLLHYYHAAKRHKASALAVAVFDEMLTIFEHGVHDPYRLSPITLRFCRSAVTGYLETLESAFIKPAKQAPPPPDLTLIGETGVPLVAKEQFEAAIDRLAHRRKLLLGMVTNDGWTWPPDR